MPYPERIRRLLAEAKQEPYKQPKLFHMVVPVELLGLSESQRTHKMNGRPAIVLCEEGRAHAIAIKAEQTLEPMRAVPYIQDVNCPTCLQLFQELQNKLAEPMGKIVTSGVASPQKAEKLKPAKAGSC